MGKPDGGQAFPCVFKIDQGENGLDGQPTTTPQQHIVLGMSLRAWFAGQAICGMHARDGYDPGQETPNQRARQAVIDADALIAELERW